MLIDELGFRPASTREIAKVAVRRLTRRFRSVTLGELSIDVPLAVLHGDPLIAYCGIVPGAPLGLASLIGNRLARKAAWFLLSPTWSIEEDSVARWLRREALSHRLRNPAHRIVFMCNTDGEAALMRGVGEAAFVHNKTTNIDDRIFKPLAGKPVEFDAIYNAQLLPWKRHQLTLEIPRCAFLYYRSQAPDFSSSLDSEAGLIGHHAKVAPGHVFLNEIDDAGMPARVPPPQVNGYLNRADVGLCLSEREGAMFACAEYLLSGLATLTTPNWGGRNFYLDDEFFITVPPDPRSIAEAVAALQNRKIPRDYVRARTFRRIEAERARLIRLINAVRAECGLAEDFPGFWPLKRPVIMQWSSAEEVVQRAISGIVDDLGPDTLRN